MSLEYVWLSYNVGITAFKMGRIWESPLTLCWKCTERIIVAGDVEQIFQIQNTGNYGLERAECNILVFDCWGSASFALQQFLQSRYRW